MEFESRQFSEEELKAGENLFQNSAEFVLGVAQLSQLPAADRPEIAFAGRSNVGKSSIINALTGQKGLAKTSNTPGRTQQLNYFDLDGRLHFVDMPGYGFAQAPEKLVRQWQAMIFTYLQGRVNLKRVFLLIDARHGIKKVDKEVMEMLDKAAVTYQIVLTKTDKISETALTKVRQETEAEAAKHAAAYSLVLATSAEKKQGLEELRAEIASLATL